MQILVASAEFISHGPLVAHAEDLDTIVWDGKKQFSPSGWRTGKGALIWALEMMCIIPVSIHPMLWCC